MGCGAFCAGAGNHWSCAFYIEYFKVGDELYGSTVLEKNKKYAEQGAALVAVKCLNITEQSIVWKEKENALEISNGHKVS